MKTKATYTPGPWIVDNYARIYGPEHPRSQHKNKREFIAHIVDDGGRHYPHVDSGSVDTTGQANARLIAAAPELLEALKAVKYWLDKREIKTLHDALISAAIAKATP